MSDNNNESSKQKNYTVLSLNRTTKFDPSAQGSKSVSVEVKRRRARTFVPKTFVSPKEEKPVEPEKVEEIVTPEEVKVVPKEPVEEVSAKAPVEKEAPKETTNTRFTAKKQEKEPEKEKEEFKKLGAKKPLLRSKYEFGMKGGSNKIAVQNIDRVGGKERSFASIKRARDKMRRLKENNDPKEKTR